MVAAALAPSPSTPAADRQGPRDAPPHMEPVAGHDAGQDPVGDLDRQQASDGKRVSLSVVSGSQRFHAGSDARSVASSAGGAQSYKSRKSLAKNTTQRDEDDEDLKASLVNGRLPEELRHPHLAWMIMTTASTPQSDPPRPSLLQEAQWFLVQEWSPDWLSDHTVSAGKMRWSMMGLTRDRIRALAQGLQDTVHAMCKLETRKSDWYFDPNGRLFKILEGAQAKHFIYDDFLVIREHVRQAVEMLNYRADLHSGGAPAYAPSSTVFVLYLPDTVEHPRLLLDLHLSKRHLTTELMASYRQQVVARVHDDADGNKSANQSHCLTPLEQSLPHSRRNTVAVALNKQFRPVSPLKQPPNEDLPAPPAQLPGARPALAFQTELPVPPHSPGNTPIATSTPAYVPSTSRAFPAHPDYAARVREAAYPSR